MAVESADVTGGGKRDDSDKKFTRTEDKPVVVKTPSRKETKTTKRKTTRKQTKRPIEQLDDETLTEAAVDRRARLEGPAETHQVPVFIHQEEPHREATVVKVVRDSPQKRAAGEVMFKGVVETEYTDGASLQVESAAPPEFSVSREIHFGDDKGKVLVKMERRNRSWTTEGGVVFTREHPFQLVDEGAVEGLLRTDGFRRAKPEEVADFYGG